MLAPEMAHRGAAAEQGSFAAVFAELQTGPAAPQVPDGAFRQRLLILADRLARVQALQGQHARVGFSPHVRVLLAGSDA